MDFQGERIPKTDAVLLEYSRIFTQTIRPNKTIERETTLRKNQRVSSEPCSSLVLSGPHSDPDTSRFVVFELEALYRKD